MSQFSSGNSSRGMLAVALALNAFPAAATTVPPSEARSVRATGLQMLALVDEMTRRGTSPQARPILELLTHDPDPQVRSEARFRLAKLLTGAGKISEAAVLLRRVVDDHPTAAPARLELANLLYRMGDEGAALRELRALSTLDLPLNIARFVDRTSASLQAARPLGIQLELAIAPDSNINHATQSETLDTVFGRFLFDKNSQARSGVGGAVRTFARGRIAVARNVNLTAHASIDAKLYRHREFNDVSFEVAAGPEFRLGPTRLSLEAGAGEQWFGMKPYQQNLRLSASGWLKVDDVSQLRFDGSARWGNNRVNDLQDGRGIAFAARYERALSPQLTFALGAVIDRFAARDAAYSTRSWNISAAAYRDIGRMMVEVGAEIGGLQADKRLQILPSSREDKVMRFHVGAVLRRLTVAGFSPTLRLVIERNRSTIAFYDYKRTRTEFGITRAF